MIWFTSASSTAEDPDLAVEELVRAIGTESGRPDIAFLFFTRHHRHAAARISGKLQEQLGIGQLVGCSAEGVIGGDSEIEQQAGVALLVGSLPGAELTTAYIAPHAHDQADTELKLPAITDCMAVIMLGDPFSVLAELPIHLQYNYPGAIIAGGMASGALRRGGNALIMNEELYTSGAVCLMISGDVEVESIVSQGCQPIGHTMLVTDCQGNFLTGLNNRPALDALQDMVDNITDEEEELLQNGLFMGVVVNEYQSEFKRGDFLIRTVSGIHQPSGAIVVDEELRKGQTVQFHVRDAGTATDDLYSMIGASAERGGCRGGLIFSCNGRGSNMFPGPNHDLNACKSGFSNAAFAGFFAMGEIGMVGGKPFLHGFTASLLLFKEKVD